MDFVGRRVENQVHFWSYLGPFLIMLSIGVLLFKVSEHWYFPVSALIGLPLCVKWKMKGLAAALGFLLLFSGLTYPSLELDERYWHVGLSLAMAFSFIIMTLSLEEVQGLIHTLQAESNSRLDNFTLLDENFKGAELAWNVEREKTKAEAAALAQEIASTLEEKQTFHKLAQLSKEELVQVRGQHDLVLHDLFYKKQQIAQLHERLEETELSLQEWVNSEQSITNLKKEKESLTIKLERMLEEKELLVRELQNKRESYAKESELRENLENKIKELEGERENLLDCQQTLRDQLENEKILNFNGEKCLEEKKQLLNELQNALRKQVEENESHSIRLENECRALSDLKEQYSQLAYASTAQQEMLKNSENALNEKRLHLDLLNSEINTLKTQFEAEKNQLDLKIVEREQYKEKLLQEISNLKEAEQNVQEALFLMRQKLFEQSQSAQDEMFALQKSLELTQSFLEIKNIEYEELTEKLSQKEKNLNETVLRLQNLEALNVKLEEAKEQMAKQSIEEINAPPSSSRQNEAMYLQLRQQFQEKCQILDETRRQLFMLNEELLRCQKEKEEETCFNYPSHEKSLERDLLRLSRRYDKMEARYQLEIDELSSLIQHLFGNYL